MFIDIILLAIGFIGILIGTITDLQKREVADWLNYSLMVSGIGLRLLYSVNSGEWSFTAWGITGLLVGYLIGALMYYSGQWGGGDAKMLMGLGALFATFRLPIPDFSLISLHTPLVFFLLFFAYTLVAGAFLGVVYSVIQALVYRKGFAAAWKNIIKEKIFRRSRIAVLAGCAAFVALAFVAPFPFNLSFITLAAAVFLGFYIMAFVKAVEHGCMVQKTPVKKLVEGDWIIDDIWVEGKKSTLYDEYLDQEYALEQFDELNYDAWFHATVNKWRTYRRNTCTPAKAARHALYTIYANYHSKSAYYIYALTGSHAHRKTVQELLEATSLRQALPPFKALQKSGIIPKNEKLEHMLEDCFGFRYGKRYLTGPRSLGLEEEPLAMLHSLAAEKKISWVQVKVGMPFVPAFLAALIIILLSGAALLNLLL